jgi:hypothetical protein
MGALYSNEILEQTDTLKFTAFFHGQGTRFTIYDRVEGGQWRMLLQGNNEKVAKEIFEELKSGAPLRRLS